VIRLASGSDGHGTRCLDACRHGRADQVESRALKTHWRERQRGGPRGAGRTRGREAPYSLIHAHNYGKPRQCSLSGRSEGRERGRATPTAGP
jgi:hypothetical protein